jgi:hypothetical protein
MKLRLVKDLTAVLLELPISVVEGANLASLQPSGDTMEMEGVLATHSQSLLMEARKSLLRCKSPMQQCTPRWWRKLDLPDIRCLPVVSRSSSRVGVGDELHRSIMWFLQIAQLSTTMSQAHRATAFHYRAVSISAAPCTEKASSCSHLLHLKALLAVCSALRTSGFSLANCLLRRGWDIGHNDVGHVQIAEGSRERRGGGRWRGS